MRESGGPPAWRQSVAAAAAAADRIYKPDGLDWTCCRGYVLPSVRVGEATASREGPSRRASTAQREPWGISTAALRRGVWHDGAGRVAAASAAVAAERCGPGVTTPAACQHACDGGRG
eukprot:359210-Chlamydomonas_euryale.AAC.2